jgi:hypothetical protein
MSKVQQAYNNFIQSLGTATNSMNFQIKNSILIKDAIDTGKMRNTSFIKIILDKENMKPIEISIDSTEYYKFVDQGTKHITPREITKYFMNTDEFKRELNRVVAAWSVWQTTKAINDTI